MQNEIPTASSLREEFRADVIKQATDSLDISRIAGFCYYYFVDGKGKIIVTPPCKSKKEAKEASALLKVDDALISPKFICIPGDSKTGEPQPQKQIIAACIDDARNMDMGHVIKVSEEKKESALQKAWRVISGKKKKKKEEEED